MKRKKLLSLILALAMALSLAVPAFASGASTTSGDKQSLNMIAGMNTGVINFTMGPATPVILNPYQMKATVNSGDSTGSYRQIYSPAVKCINNSTFPLSIDATVTVKPSAPSGSTASTAKIVSAVPSASVTNEKQVFLYAEFGVSDNASTEPVWATAYNKSATNQVLASQTGTSKTGVAKLAATNGTANYLWFKFDGAATKTPDVAWLPTDTVDATVALTLKSVVSEVYPITVTNTVVANAKGTATLNYDVAPAGETITLTCAADASTNTAKPAVTIKGVANDDITHTDNTLVWSFPMPAAAVTITVKWAAS